MITDTKPATHEITVTVNGEARAVEVEPRLLLVHFLREKLALTGTHVGCDTTSCGACTVLVDGVPIKSCTHFAVQVDGREVTTVEGLAQGGQLHPVQEGFKEEHGLQCGFCTPAMMLVERGAARGEPGPTRGGDPLGAVGEHLPLHGVPEHRQVGAMGRDEEEGGVMTAVESEHKGWLGRSVKRKEDSRFIVGRGNYIEDIKLPNMLQWPSCAARSRTPRSTRSTPARERAARRRRRGHRRDPGRAQPGLDADALRRHAGRARNRQGADAGPGGRLRHRGRSLRRARCAGADRRRLRPLPS